MAEYIKREALVAEIEENINTYWNEGSGGYYLAEDALNYSVKTAPTADVVEIETIKDWLYKIAINNVGCGIDGDFSNTCEEIITRLDGLRNFARERGAE